MNKIIRLVQLVLTNFAGVRNVVVDYGNINQLSGHNGVGKTSIGTAPVWILWGKDLYGNDYTKDKYSPRPSNYEYKSVQASIILSVNGNEYKFAREVDKKSNKFYINDIPKSATEYSEAVKTLFTQDEFMSMYFPSYFFSLHWTKQRELLLNNALAPLAKTVLAKLAEPQSEKLAELLKKNSLKDIEAKYKDDKPKLDKQLIEASRDVETLSKQAEKVSTFTQTREELEATKAECDAIIKQLENNIAKAHEQQVKYASAEHRFNLAKSNVLLSKNNFASLKDEVIEDTCKTCKQPLQEESVKSVQADKERRIEEYKAKHALLVEERKAALEALQAIELIDVTEDKTKLAEYVQKRNEVIELLPLLEVKESLETDIAAAQQNETEVREKLRNTVFILDSIKAYKAKEAEIQADELQKKFKTLSVRLFNYVKSKDEYEPFFSIQKDGKDYASLSVGEKIGAGLELIDVLFEQTQMITPVFIDGIGEYTGDITAYDQVITARAVKGQKLTIEVKE